MSDLAPYLSGAQARAQWMRYDTAQILKRFFFCERSFVVSAAAWLPLLESITMKTELPRFIWQSSQTADALRERIFELRYPNRLLEIGNDALLVALLNELRNAPSPAALLRTIAHTVVPALRKSYQAYLAASDLIADGPTHRFLGLAVQEKTEQAAVIGAWAETLLAAQSPTERESAIAWSDAFAHRLDMLGAIGIQPIPDTAAVPPLVGSRPYAIPDQPARDPQFALCRFYWPDIVDPDFAYGEGTALQLRSAVSHLNEVWAVETAGIILSAFADVLPWEWIKDAARWTYDESRHCRMGYERLLAWGFAPEELPLGSYIYDSAAGQDPIYRLGMLFFFETKNIKKKPTRAKLFHEYGDAVSEHDMDFDWADETIHAGYGKYWLKELLAARGQDAADYETIRDACAKLVAACVATATDQEIAAIKHIANMLTNKAMTSMVR